MIPEYFTHQVHPNSDHGRLADGSRGDRSLGSCAGTGTDGSRKGVRIVDSSLPGGGGGGITRCGFCRLFEVAAYEVDDAEAAESAGVASRKLFRLSYHRLRLVLW